MIMRLIGRQVPANIRRSIIAANQSPARHSEITTMAKYFMSSQASRTKGLKQPPDGPDPYLYTSGRWLNRDQLQRTSRSIHFDFLALCAKAVELCPGANNIASYDKKEGGFNRVFLFTMDNGARVAARLPFRVAGPARLTTHSEVATMAYIRKNTNIPVPEVLEWNDDKTNPIGAEYIIMEHAPGVQLHGLWPGMNPEQHMLTVKALAKSIQSMATLPFPAYGSLYFADAPIDQELKVPHGDFCIGPHCGWEYWDCTAGEARYYDQRKPNRGPWPDLSQYCSALLDAGFSRIPRAEVAPKDELAYRGSVQEHLRLLKINEEVIPELIKSPLIQDLATPTLLHADLNKRNIFVSEDDPTVITSVIDWQSTSIEPTFVYAKVTPDLIPIRPPPISVLGDAAEVPPQDPDEPAETPEEKRERQRLENDIWISRQTFEVGMKAWVPRIHAARVADSTLLRPLRYCSTSWRDSATAVRQELIELSQRWTELGLPGACPYQPSPKELADHVDLYEQFDAMQRLKDFLAENFDSDSEGWIPPEAWEMSKEIHKNAVQTWMEDAREGGDPKLTVEIAEKLWPYDHERNGSP